MVFGLAAAVVVALGAIVFALMAQQKLAANTEKAAKAASEAEAEISELSTSLKQSESKLSTAMEQASELKSEKTKLDSELTTVTGKLASAEGDLKAAQEAAASAKSDLETTSAERDKLKATIAKDKEASANARKEEALDSLSGATPVRAATLWELELERSVRTWRNSVAANPQLDTTPLDDSDNPVRTAVEIEADALREDVGAAVRVDWKAGAVEDPARCHLVLRLAQEMMASAAREPQPTVLIVEGDDELTLRIEPDDESGDSIIAVSPPKIESELVDVTSDRGLIVTLKSTEQEVAAAES